MPKYTIVLEQTIVEEYDVEANSPEEALQEWDRGASPDVEDIRSEEITVRDSTGKKVL